MAPHFFGGCMATGDRIRTATEVVITNDKGEHVNSTYYMPSDGNTDGLIGERSYRCSICGLAFKAGQVMHFRGKVYGVPCGDAKDINSILESENARNKTVARSNERVSDFDFGS